MEDFFLRNYWQHQQKYQNIALHCTNFLVFLPEFCLQSFNLYHLFSKCWNLILFLAGRLLLVALVLVMESQASLIYCFFQIERLLYNPVMALMSETAQFLYCPSFLLRISKKINEELLSRLFGITGVALRCLKAKTTIIWTKSNNTWKRQFFCR